MLNKNNKRSFKTQAALMTLGTLAPMAPALMSNVGTIIANADATAAPVPVQQHLSTPSDEDFPLLPFTWSIKVVNQQNNQTLKTDDITFTPTQNYTIGKDGGTEVHYSVKDTADIFNSNDYKVTNGEINFNDIINQLQGGSIRGNKYNSMNNKGDFENWVFGKKNADGLTTYILPELNNRDGQATQQAKVSGSDDHKVLTFYVIPNTSQTKNKTNNNNSGNYVVPATGQDTGNNKATNSNNDGSTTNNSGNGAIATNGNHNNANNSGTSSNKTTTNSNSQQNDADTQQIINAINQHAVNSNDKLPSDAKLLEQVPANTQGFNSFSVQVSQKDGNGQITYKHLNVHYNPTSKQFFVTEQGQNTALTKAQLLQLFGLQSKDGNGGSANTANGVAGSNNLGGTTSSSAGGLAQTNTQTKQNASILLSAIVGTATLGLGLTKDGKLKLD